MSISRHTHIVSSFFNFKYLNLGRSSIRISSFHKEFVFLLAFDSFIFLLRLF